MNDRDLLIAIKATDNHPELVKALWDRYQNLIHKHWSILRKQLDNSSRILSSKDDFYSECYIAFMKAVDAINLDKIRDDNWKFLGYLRLYVGNVRNAMIDRILRVAENETSLFAENSEGDEIIRTDISHISIENSIGRIANPEEAVINEEAEDRCKRAVAQCMSTWDEKKREIFLLREKGVSKSNIATVLGVHPATITYHLKIMKGDLENKLFS